MESRIARLEGGLDPKEVQSLALLSEAVQRLENQWGVVAEHASGVNDSLAPASPEAKRALLEAASARIDRYAENLKVIQESVQEAFDEAMLKGSIEQRARLLSLIQNSLLPLAVRAEALRKQTSEALTAYGLLVDAATDLTLKIEAKLV